MATTGIEPDKTWQKITDGTETAALQVKRGVIAICDADEQPGDDAEYQDHARNLTITPPTIAWIKNITPGKDGEPGYAKVVIIK
ncbi:hypothetical protein [Pantoea stewartii]|uniref:Uncharacterized protein n=1 Tax=Pantoea stewartii subsp. stewartii DC283 TaxID=660596 RepID=H3RLL3_PANSE|nr:hypothetical protein [Pantoea stewartii]ARF52770.1 hypothetical protein DSJ_26545 [Pantoea stewartii subsp. stewartii DC283]EHT97726.1 hypothetical protein CKS_5588 [Pantoea stewartii subsp. stewartii DC283]KAB0553997.1 hypothetical protein F7Q90_12455 [Pantoea stewartii subsp. stewartii]